MRFFCLCAALVISVGCGGAQPTGAPSEPTQVPVQPAPTPAPAAGPSVDVIAHFFTWHIKNGRRNDWGNASTIPWRSDGNGIGYDSTNTTIIAEQAKEMKEYGLTPLLSWRGRDEEGGDQFLNAWCTTVADLPAAIMYEGEARLQRHRDGWWYIDSRANARTIRNDLTHLYEQYWAPNPGLWYRRHGKFVIYLWPGHAMSGDLRGVLAELPFRDRLYVVTTEFDGLRLPQDSRMGMLAGVDAVTGYGFYSKPLMNSYPIDPTTGKVPLSDELVEQYRSASLRWKEYLAARLPEVELILPLELAFDDRLLPYRDNPVYEATPEQANRVIDEIRQIADDSWVSCGNVAPAITYPSYNEHYEGTALEPNDRFGAQWIELIERRFRQEHLSHASCQ